MKIRAAVLEEFGKPLVVQEVDLAEPKAGEVLVRLEACGVCHTDLYTASGADPTGYAQVISTDLRLRSQTQCFFQHSTESSRVWALLLSFF